MTQELEYHFRLDIEAVQKISVIPSILQVICKTTGMRFAAVARVTEERWVACAVRDEIEFGLAVGGELKIETTICHEIRQSGDLVAINHVSEDEVYRYHHTPKIYGLESYISVPIVLKDGSFFGTLCAIDPAPAEVANEDTIEMFKLYAELVAMHLFLLKEQEMTETKLIAEQKASAFRNKFIAVLGHDLNNPLNAVMLSSQMIKEITKDESVSKLARIINDSSKRMNELIEHVLDFAKGHLSDGIQLERCTHDDIGKLLRGVIDEFKVIHPGRIVNASFHISKPLDCDDKRLAQLFSNLLSNAFKFGTPDKPITVYAGYNEQDFILSVANFCDPIPASDVATLFQPFHHGLKTGTKGLGLGLYIANEIAKAHHANLAVSSTEEQTIFTFQLPICIDKTTVQ